MTYLDILTSFIAAIFSPNTQIKSIHEVFSTKANSILTSSSALSVGSICHPSLHHIIPGCPRRVSLGLQQVQTTVLVSSLVALKSAAKWNESRYNATLINH